MKKHVKNTLLIIIMMLVSFSSKCQNNSTNNIAIDTCKCIEDTLGTILILKHKLNKTNIAVYGHDNEYLVEKIKKYGGIIITDCSTKKLIKNDELNNLDWYEVKVDADTLFLNFYYYINESLSCKLYQILYYYNNDSIQTLYRLDKSYKLANSNELKKLRKKYLSFNSKSKDLYKTGWEQKIDNFGNQLFYAAISGDKDAKNRLLNYEKYYPSFLGAISEEFDFYVATYKELQDYKIIKKVSFRNILKKRNEKGNILFINYDRVIILYRY